MSKIDGCGRATAGRMMVVAALGLLLNGCGDDGATDGTTTGSGAAGGAAGQGGQGGDGGSGDEVPSCYPATLDSALCDPDVATFSLTSTNPYYPLIVGSEVILEGMEDGELITIERRVLDETEVVAGVTTHVLEAIELVDGEIYEIARNFYVEASDGTVCYFGEDVEFYEGGRVINNDGSWRAGVDGGKPGIIMPADPAPGDAYYQEVAPPDIALDQGRVDTIGTTETFGADSYDDVVTIQDSNPLEAGSCDEPEPKLYVPGIGEAADDVKRMVSFTPGE